MKHAYRLLLGFSLCGLLVACGSSSARDDCSQEFWNGIVGTCVSSGWELLDRETLRQRGVPEETVAAFQAEEPVSGQFPTLTITRERLPSETDPERYSDASIRSVAVLEGYEEVDMQEVKLDGHEVRLHIFTAQPLEGEPRRKFYQVSTAVEDEGFTATAVVPVSVESSLEKSIISMMEAMTFEEPAAEEE